MLDEAISSLIMLRLRGLTQSQALAAIRHYGTAMAALTDSQSIDSHWAAILRDAIGIQEARECALREMEFCQEHRIEVIPYSSDKYPLRLRQVKDAPIVLFYRGTTALNHTHSISIVGTRHITEYGKQMCNSLIKDLREMLPNSLIVSGLAYGVDIHTHRACLKYGIDTVGVLAHGLDRIYPRRHEKEAREMLSHGGLLTEYFTGTNPDKGNFVRRNRIVAGMTAATLVVESAAHGGSLITTAIASSLGREVMAVPGRITDEYSAGCNHLISQKKASIITSAADILHIMGWESAPVQGEVSLFPTFSPEQERILAMLSKKDAITMDGIANQLGTTSARVANLLFDLEDAELVVRMPGNFVRKA